MKFVATKEKLARVVQQAAAIVPKDSSIPILDALLFEANNGHLHVRGTNLQTTVIANCSVEVETPGAIAVPAKKLEELLGSMADGNVSFETTGAGVKDKQKMPKLKDEFRGVFKTEKSRFTMKCESADEFPGLSASEWLFKFKYAGAQLFDMLSAAAVAVSVEDHREVLKGILVECEPDKLNIVTTDGHRLIRMRDPHFNGPPKQVCAIAPVEIVKAFKPAADDFDVEVAIADDKLSIANERVQIVVKLIAGKYPEYKKIWPDEFTKKLTMSHDDLLASFRRMHLFASDIDNKVRCEFEGQKLALSARDGANEAFEQIATPAIENPLKILFNDKYMLSLLKTLRGERVAISFTRHDGPTIFEPEPQGEIEQHMLLMPLREDKD